MLINMWVLVLLFDPVNFNEWAQTQQNLEWSERGFYHEYQCEAAKTALTWGVPVGGMMSRGYACVRESAWIRLSYLPESLPKSYFEVGD